MNDCFRGDKCHMVHAAKEEVLLILGMQIVLRDVRD